MILLVWVGRWVWVLLYFGILWIEVVVAIMCVGQFVWIEVPIWYLFLLRNCWVGGLLACDWLARRLVALVCVYGFCFEWNTF